VQEIEGAVKILRWIYEPFISVGPRAKAADDFTENGVPLLHPCVYVVPNHKHRGATVKIIGHMLNAIRNQSSHVGIEAPCVLIGEPTLSAL
jgi:hypothetical protein